MQEKNVFDEEKQRWNETTLGMMSEDEQRPGAGDGGSRFQRSRAAGKQERNQHFFFSRSCSAFSQDDVNGAGPPLIPGGRSHLRPHPGCWWYRSLPNRKKCWINVANYKVDGKKWSNAALKTTNLHEPPTERAYLHLIGRVYCRSTFTFVESQIYIKLR